jgi:hypothetical protein
MVPCGTSSRTRVLSQPSFRELEADGRFMMALLTFEEHLLGLGHTLSVPDLNSCSLPTQGTFLLIGAAPWDLTFFLRGIAVRRVEESMCRLHRASRM